MSELKAMQEADAEFQQVVATCRHLRRTLSKHLQNHLIVSEISNIQVQQHWGVSCVLLSCVQSLPSSRKNVFGGISIGLQKKKEPMHRIKFKIK